MIAEVGCELIVQPAVAVAAYVVVVAAAADVAVVVAVEIAAVAVACLVCLQEERLLEVWDEEGVLVEAVQQH